MFTIRRARLAESLRRERVFHVHEHRSVQSSVIDLNSLDQRCSGCGFKRIGIGIKIFTTWNQLNFELKKSLKLKIQNRNLAREVFNLSSQFHILSYMAENLMGCTFQICKSFLSLAAKIRDIGSPSYEIFSTMYDR